MVLFLNCNHRRYDFRAQIHQDSRCTDVKYVNNSRREPNVHRNIKHGQTGHGNDDVQSTINTPFQNDVSIQEIVQQVE